MAPACHAINTSGAICILICGGDSMLGRAVNLTLPRQSPGDESVTDSCPASWYLQAALHRDARCMAPSFGEELQSIRRENFDGFRLWGDLLQLSLKPPPDLRLFNLETAVTETITNSDIPQKGINYHMHIANLSAFKSISAAKHGGSELVPYVVSLANNHILDFGRRAFEVETLAVLKPVAACVGAAGAASGAEEKGRTGLPGLGIAAGVGFNWAEASRPASLRLHRAEDVVVHVFAFACACAGVPRDWAATQQRSGVAWLPPVESPDEADAAFCIIATAVAAAGIPRDHGLDLLIISMHWGPNWAYRYAGDGQQHRRKLAYRLVDELGVDLIYGHSSHHVRGLEIHNGKLVIYGAGDLVNDYEGFKNKGDEAFSHLALVFAVDVEAGSGQAIRIIAAPMMMDCLALRRVTRETSFWDPHEHQSFLQPRMVETLAARVNALSARDAGSLVNSIIFSVEDDSRSVGMEPAGPVLLWQRNF